LPRVLEHRIGTRPFAIYVTGEIEAREILVEPPPRAKNFSIWVADVDGGGHWRRRLRVAVATWPPVPENDFVRLAEAWPGYVAGSVEVVQ
jgi:hypothetical protein